MQLRVCAPTSPYFSGVLARKRRLARSLAPRGLGWGEATDEPGQADKPRLKVLGIAAVFEGDVTPCEYGDYVAVQKRWPTWTSFCGWRNFVQ